MYMNIFMYVYECAQIYVHNEPFSGLPPQPCPWGGRRETQPKASRQPSTFPQRTPSQPQPAAPVAGVCLRVLQYCVAVVCCSFESILGTRYFHRS